MLLYQENKIIQNIYMLNNTNACRLNIVLLKNDWVREKINREIKREEGRKGGRERERERYRERWKSWQNREEQQKFLLKAQHMLTMFSVVCLRRNLGVTWQPHSDLIFRS